MSTDPASRQRRRRRNQSLAIIIVLGLFAAMVTYQATRPDPAVREITTMSQQLTEMDPAQMTEAERRDLQDKWARLSPDSQQQIMHEVGRARLQQFRQQVAALTPDERRAMIDQEVQRMRAEYAKLSDAERADAKQRLSSEDGQRWVMNMMGFFDSELTARERAEMDPLLREWVKQINAIVEGS